jgi:hypothetical protein
MVPIIALLAATSGLLVLVATARASPLISSSCSDELLLLCDTARRASVGNCLGCASMHQHDLKTAGCNQAQIEPLCTGDPPTGGPLKVLVACSRRQPKFDKDLFSPKTSKILFIAFF